MNPSFERTTANSSHRSAADNSSEDGIAIPAVPSRQDIPEETAADMEEPLLLDMDEDGVDEEHTLLLEDDVLYLHSDKQTLSLFIARKKKKKLSKQEMVLLSTIEKLALVVHKGKYGTKDNSTGKSKRKAPVKNDKIEARKALQKIALLLADLNDISKSPGNVMKKKRPPSHEKLLVTKMIQGETFGHKVVMEPLSVLPRDDGKRGSPPKDVTNLWTRLTKMAGYKRGHMLNEHLHGPGIFENLVPISTAFNSTMKTGVEHVTKEAVNANNKVVRFEAEALHWGNFKGALGAPDEQLLPSHFRFKVTQMTLIPNQKYDGSHISHWEENTSKPVIFDATLVHDIPVDVKKGAVAHVTKDFAPGFYFHPGGAIQQVSPTEYHLRGFFSVNNNSQLFPALAMDAKANLSYDIINERVTTKYRVPPGYHIVLPYGPENLEYILYNDEIKTTPSPTPAFLIVNTSQEANLKSNFEDEKKLARERLQARQKLVLDRQAMEEQQKKEREERRRLEMEEKERKKLEEKKNEDFRHELYRIIRAEARKHESKFDGDFIEHFQHYREKILYNAGLVWKRDDQLYTKDIDTLLDPCRKQLEETKNMLLERQANYEEQEEIKRQEEERVRLEEEKLLLAEETERTAVVDHLVQQVNEKSTNDHLPNLNSEAGQEYYLRKKKELLDKYIPFWENEIDVLKANIDKLLASVLDKLEQIYGSALKVPDKPVKKQTPPTVPVKRKLVLSNEEKKKEDEDRSIKKRIPQDRYKFQPPQSNTTTFHNSTTSDPFKYNLGFNSNQDRMEEEENVQQDRFTLPSTQPNFTFNIPTPFKFNQGFGNDRNRPEEDRTIRRSIQQDRFSLPPTRPNTTTRHEQTSFFNFSPGTQQQHHHQPIQKGDVYRNTARQIDGAAASAYDYYQDTYLKEQLFRLKQPLESFMQQPTIDGWILINKILWEMLDIDALKWFADKWLPMWDDIKPS